MNRKLNLVKVVTYIFVLLLPYEVFGLPMRYAEYAMPESLNPLNIQDAISLRLSSLLYNSLVGFDINMNPSADLLDTLTPQRIDSRRYNFTLRKNVVWHDNIPLTAEDVEFTFRMITNPQTETNLKWLNGLFSDVQAIGSHTIQFTLKTEIPEELFLGRMFFNIIPKHIFEPTTEFISDEEAFGKTKVIGTGPYYFYSRGTDKKIRLKWNESYFKGFRKLNKNLGDERIDEIIMMHVDDPLAAKDMLINGGIYLLPEVRPSEWEEIEKSAQQTGCKLIKHSSRSFAFFAYNCNHKFLKDKLVRQALTYAIDIEAMIKNVYGEKVPIDQIMYSPHPREESNPDIEPRKYNVEQAKKLLAKAGFIYDEKDKVLKKNGEPFIVSLKAYVTNEKAFSRICDMYQTRLSDIGVKIMIGNEERVYYMEMKKWINEVVRDKNFDIAFGRWNFHPEAEIVEEIFSPSEMRKGGNNFVSYRNSDLEKLIIENETLSDPEARLKNKHEMDRIIYDDCPYTFLFPLPAYAGVRTNELKGVDIHPYHFFTYITNWYIRE
ncbi:MAG: ABC transporter substrate-binding protein [bacterium]